ncbi:MAG: glycosyltransferase [Candidatus Contubernalis sp.]|nr:glycosyltransferase [Candidatus Contubernalis sp.]
MAEAIKLLYPPGMQWEVMVQRPHHLLKLAAEAGWQVIWCEVGPYRKPVEVLPNFWVIRDLQSMAAFAPYHLAYITDPLQLKYIDSRIRPQLLVYDRCDPRGPAEYRLMKEADLVLSTTSCLMQEAQQYSTGRVLLVPNAADPKHFKDGEKREPGKPPVIGYVGVLAAHLDYRLLNDLISARPHYNWLFAGQEKEVDLPENPAVRRLGHVHYEELPALLSQMDAVMVPFLNTPHTRVVESVKIFEYLAAGKQVVASQLAPLEKREWPIRLAADTEHWLESLEAALSAGPYCEQAQTWIKDHTWRHRFAQMYQAVMELLS